MKKEQEDLKILGGDSKNFLRKKVKNIWRTP
jgi:hypothetical protein